MKTLSLLIIMCLFVTGLGLAWLLVNYYDITPATKENEYGIHVLVVRVPPFMGGCEKTPCHQPEYMLKLNSKSHAFLTGYDICKGIFCVRQEGLSVSLDTAYPMDPFVYVPINTAPWKINDTVNIRLNISPPYNMAGTYIPFPYRTNFIDLGNSEVIFD
jgi:hypothetical protein